MKKGIIILTTLTLVASSCKQTTTEQSKIQISQNEKYEIPDTSVENSSTSTEQKYLIKERGIDIFLIGQEIPIQPEGYSITKSIETRTEEGEDFKIPVYTVSEGTQKILNIEPLYDYSKDDYGNKVDNIFILSDKFKTVKNIGLHSTIEEFKAAYPDFSIWFSYVSDRYVMETKQLQNIQFVLDGKDFLKEGGPEFDSDMTILKDSDFKKGAKIKEIRIWGYGE